MPNRELLSAPSRNEQPLALRQLPALVLRSVHSRAEKSDTAGVSALRRVAGVPANTGRRRSFLETPE